MKQPFIICLCLLASVRVGAAQVSGGAGTYRGGATETIDPARIERAKRAPTPAEVEDKSGSTYVDAAVLMNVRADEYVAVFALFTGGETPDAAAARMEATLNDLTPALDRLGVAPADRNVDYVSQGRTYSYELSTLDKADDAGNLLLATEKMNGFELKKNLSIRFGDIDKLGALTDAAALVGIFDLVKVDYIVRDAAAIRERLQLQTLGIIRQKTARYNATLGTKLGNPTQIVADSPGIYYPIDQYDSYTAAETQGISQSYNRSRTTIVSERKPRSTYFNPLNGDGFDAVINPVIVEPVVQFTTYVKVKYAAPKK